MKHIYWTSSNCDVAGHVDYEVWDFQTVVRVIAEAHNKICPYGRGWRFNENLDVEVAEGLRTARVRHLQ